MGGGSGGVESDPGPNSGDAESMGTIPELNGTGVLFPRAQYTGCGRWTWAGCVGARHSCPPSCTGRRQTGHLRRMRLQGWPRRWRQSRETSGGSGHRVLDAGGKSSCHDGLSHGVGLPLLPGPPGRGPASPVASPTGGARAGAAPGPNSGLRGLFDWMPAATRGLSDRGIRTRLRWFRRRSQAAPSSRRPLCTSDSPRNRCRARGWCSAGASDPGGT
jgi:hypothetical protein